MAPERWDTVLWGPMWLRPQGSHKLRVVSSQQEEVVLLSETPRNSAPQQSKLVKRALPHVRDAAAATSGFQPVRPAEDPWQTLTH